MPNITNQNISIDSLQAKVVALENTIKEANIKTSFFSDQLAFQLFVFSCILGVLALFSWGLILRPFQNKIKRLSTVTIPKLVNDVKVEKDNQIAEIKEAYDALSTLVFKSHIASLRQSAALSTMQKDLELSFQTLVFYLATDLKYHGSNINKTKFMELISSVQRIISTKDFDFSKLTSDPGELLELEGYLISLSESKDIEIKLLATKILEKFLVLKVQRSPIKH